MASLTDFPEATRSASEVFLRHLPSPSPWISKSDKDLASARTLADQVRSCFNAKRSSVAIFSSQPTLRELSQARKIWTDNGSSSFYNFETQLQLLKLLYSFRKPWEVQKFLEINKFLTSLLIEAYLEIRKYFSNPQVILEVDTDPEVINDQQLVAFITTNYSPDEALRALKQFDADWWLDALDRSQRKLCISVEFE